MGCRCRGNAGNAARGASVRNFTVAAFRTFCGGCGLWRLLFAEPVVHSGGCRLAAGWQSEVRLSGGGHLVRGAVGPLAPGNMPDCDAVHKTNPDPGCLR